MRILFMGTPDFAVFSLRALVEAGEDVAAVVTQTDKPKNRGYTLTPPPVKVYALEKNIPVYQPKTLKSEDFAALLSEIDPEMIVVAAYGKILPPNVIDYPRYGCVNVHGSLLPEYRGAAPMQRAIIDGKKQTGITIIYMDAGIDTGDMILKKSIDILPDDNFEDIHDKLGNLGALSLIEALRMIKDGTAKREKQDGTFATYAKKIEKEDCVIDFHKDALELHNLIRGLSPFPLAYTHTPDGKMLKVFKAKVSDKTSDKLPGTVVSLDGGKITVACGNSCLDILGVLPEGRGRMKASDFINGRKISVGDILASCE